MSVILITNHNESIYNITKKEIPPIHKKAAQHTKTAPKSELRRKIALTKKGVKFYATMGLPKQPPKDPHDFLKKGTGKLAMSQIPEEGVEKRQEKVRKPPVPVRTEVLKETTEKLKHERKNFLEKNIKAAEESAPKIPARRVVVTKDGSTSDLSSGLEPQHLKSDVYGKIPQYLDVLIKKSQKRLERQKDRAGIYNPKCIYITREQRQQLLAGLKQNWEELQRQYQGLPILTDTLPKKQRKSKLEADLKQLEKDIVLIERHPYIYVYDDESDM